MKMREIKELTAKQISEKLSELRAQIRDMRFKIASQQTKNVRELRTVRKNIARMLTVQNTKHEEQEVKK
ncbi:MAG: 50S ribosomal protein L29 [Candidatus Komeilibacteria bacterium RIFCSPLOWO2_01_FULL_52_15]|uniref:Large ribosomal subunit protein uL29 n=2 Tax=Candidatus Komeiliibacteriota TaxID=1817908 RepID=A0A1G2BPD2_9BACT|nr:MAG: 50S ribosomal protein L29 [Candidatus Komeilibacteria bacterium RIFCSPHIGHO2_01_FULL_52_14]OGY91015.1 MAG: 50S ribosomal protein L29 [Candidatus Komeilibacteria bacterium RIFCSPLOWO2_01_FULL_52_15]